MNIKTGPSHSASRDTDHIIVDFFVSGVEVSGRLTDSTQLQKAAFR